MKKLVSIAAALFILSGCTANDLTQDFAEEIEIDKSAYTNINVSDLQYVKFGEKVKLSGYINETYGVVGDTFLLEDGSLQNVKVQIPQDQYIYPSDLMNGSVKVYGVLDSDPYKVGDLIILADEIQ